MKPLTPIQHRVAQAPPNLTNAGPYAELFFVGVPKGHSATAAGEEAIHER